jgi:hypothetical protein
MNPDWLTGIGTLVLAVATLVLAGITAWSVRKNNEANKLLREENERLNRLERERLGRLAALDFIRNWVDEADSIIGGRMFSLQSEGPLNVLLHSTTSLRVEMEALSDASELFNDDFRAVVRDTLTKFKAFNASVFDLRDSYMENTEIERGNLKEQVINTRITALNSIIKLKTHVSKNRITLLV